MVVASGQSVVTSQMSKVINVGLDLFRLELSSLDRPKSSCLDWYHFGLASLDFGWVTNCGWTTGTILLVLSLSNRL